MRVTVLTSQFWNHHRPTPRSRASPNREPPPPPPRTVRTTDPAKRERIIRTATELFATQPYHEVRLEDVAAAAHVGKGTLYLYFKNKDQLYLSLLYDGFAMVVDRLHREDLTAMEPRSALHHLVEELVRFSLAHPHFFELSRRVGVPTGSPEWDRKRRELFDLIEAVIVRGIDRGEFHDPHPSLTARYLPSLIRAALLYPAGELDSGTLTRHILGTLMGALSVGHRLEATR
jgi:AcrR family transcriptional regulator